MKGNRLWLKILVSVALIGGASYVSLAFVEDYRSFLYGFFTCVAVGTILGLIMNSLSRSNGRKVAVRQLFVSLAYLLIGGLIGGFALYTIHKAYKTQSHRAMFEQLHQQALVDAARNSGQVYVLSELLDKIDRELDDNPIRNLSSETIKRIANMSYAFRPYRLVYGDTVSSMKLSPERGQLLVTLTALNLEQETMHKIILESSFEHADLQGANLKGAQLRGINLSSSNLRDADLRGADLGHADLNAADLWGANLDSCKCNMIDFRRADLRWAELNNAQLEQAKLGSVDLSSAKLRNADLRGADIQWATLCDAIFTGANLSDTNIDGSDLKRAQFQNADLTGANLKRTDLTGTDLSNAIMAHVNLTSTTIEIADLTDVTLDSAIISNENWFEILDKTIVKGVTAISSKYQIEADTSNNKQFLLIPLNSAE